jgi:uncharacterized protein (TIGR03503 family)
MAMHTPQVKTSTLYLMLWGLLFYVFSLTIYADTLQVPTAPTGNVVNGPSDEGKASSSFAQLLDSRSSLPVVNNHFVVDKDVTEIEIILTTDKFDSLKLLTPEGKTLIPSQTMPNITWQRIEKMYAIKVQNPIPGQWEVQGSMLTRPEVAVTSSLEMITPLFPNNFIRGETLALSAYLQENGQRIISGDLLKNMQITATLQNIATSEVYKIYLKEDEKIHLESLRGLFHYNYHLESLPGIYILNIKAVGLLFQRERQQQFYVYDYPAKISTNVSAVDDKIQVDAVVASPVLDVSTCQLSAVFHNTDGSAQTLIFDKKDATNWQLIMPYNSDIDRMTITLAGFTKDSRSVQVVFPIVNIEALYEKSYYTLQQSLELKSQKTWEKVQDQVIASLLPFSIEKQRENLIVAMNPFDDPELAPVRQYTTFEQDLLQTWQSFLFPKTADEILGLLTDTAKPKSTVLTPEQIKANELAQAKEKAQQERVAAYEHKKKIMIRVLEGICFIFVLILGALIWIVLAPKRQKKVKAEQNQELTEQAPAPVENVATAVEEPKAVIKEVTPDVKNDISALVSDDESKEEKPTVTEVINAQVVKDLPEVEEINAEPIEDVKQEKEEIKMDFKPVQAEEKVKESSDQESESITPTKEPPQRDQPTSV